MTPSRRVSPSSPTTQLLLTNVVSCGFPITLSFFSDRGNTMSSPDTSSEEDECVVEAWLQSLPDSCQEDIVELKNADPTVIRDMTADFLDDTIRKYVFPKSAFKCKEGRSDAWTCPVLRDALWRPDRRRKDFRTDLEKLHSEVPFARFLLLACVEPSVLEPSADSPGALSYLVGLDPAYGSDPVWKAITDAFLAEVCPLEYLGSEALRHKRAEKGMQQQAEQERQHGQGKATIRGFESSGLNEGQSSAMPSSLGEKLSPS
ncbi:hypothetical protein EVG20_g10837 [Dentipellis fragilis]|uniref:Uncharacterized protein n=1 Tax=Dentipellis fragilis TaxID=205917 RepID=A0A4Y9XN88_9AGAM|nr:hypothetical protein EVG20_g10837 [Dentipellis fragilis]